MLIRSLRCTSLSIQLRYIGIRFNPFLYYSSKEPHRKLMYKHDEHILIWYLVVLRLLHYATINEEVKKPCSSANV